MSSVFLSLSDIINLAKEKNFNYTDTFWHFEGVVLSKITFYFIMKNEQHSRLREQVQKIEQKILAITGKNVEFNMEWTRSQRKCEQVSRLIWKRKHLLDKMFVATPEEVVRMEQVNNRLFELTQKMYARTEALYRKMASTTYDPTFDDDVEVEGTLKFSVCGHCSVLPMANDDYYGSNFYEMLSVIDWLYVYNVLELDYIERCSCYLAPPYYRPDISREGLTLTGKLNDGTTWYESYQPAADKLSHLCICHAIHDLSDHKPYSIPDILRMNDFCVEVTIKHQHIVEQDGSRWNWWEHCSFGEFRDKFVREAEQNRAPHIRLGQEIYNRTQSYFKDYFDSLTEDMPNVEKCKELFSGKTHLHWLPQKDCFYIDENIDSYLFELFAFLRN